MKHMELIIIYGFISRKSNCDLWLIWLGFMIYLLLFRIVLAKLILSFMFMYSKSIVDWQRTNFFNYSIAKLTWIVVVVHELAVKLVSFAAKFLLYVVQYKRKTKTWNFFLFLFFIMPLAKLLPLERIKVRAVFCKLGSGCR